MAQFIINAMPASFLHCEGGPSGSYDMVSVAFPSPALLRESVEAKNLEELDAFFQAAKAKLVAGGKPYSLQVRLVAGRAPRGWNDRKAKFRSDEAFGIYSNAR